MQEIFIKFLNQSITAGWIVLIIMPLRAVMKNAPRWTVCLLWHFVWLRLIFPFSPESIFSLIPSNSTVPETIMYSDTPAINSGIDIINQAINPIISYSLTPKAGDSVNPIQLIIYAVSVIWIIGCAAMVGYMLFSWIILKRRLQTATHMEGHIYQSEAVTTPFVFGFLKPRIYVPYNISECDMEYVLAHENTHIKRKDHITRPLTFLILACYWFNPLIWAAYIFFCRDTELACDEKTIRNMSGIERKAYSSIMLCCSTNKMKINVCPLAFGEIDVKARIKKIINYKKPTVWIMALSLILCAVIAICFLTNPKKDTNNTSISTGHKDVNFILNGVDYTYGDVIINAKWQNSSDKSIIFGEEFRISRNENGNIINCDERDGSTWLLYGLVILPNGSSEMTYNITDHYDISFPEKYRFETYYWFEDREDTEYYVIVDFEVKDNNDNASTKESKKYTYVDSDDIIKPYLTLTSGNKFHLFYSSLSSYYAEGSYQLDNDLLICKTYDGKYKYTFRINGSELIFDESKSSKIPNLNITSGDKNSPAPCVPDGAVFK